MLPSEKLIEQTIKDNLDFVPAGEPATVRISYAKAAHAIAGKLAEGVVWQNQGTAVVIEDRGDGSLRLRVSAGLYSSWHLEIAGIEDEALDGQLVTVTVRTREE